MLSAGILAALMTRSTTHVIAAFTVSLSTLCACLSTRPPSQSELAAAPAGPGQAAHGDPFAAARRIGHGINLGNMLEAPHEGEWGQTIQEKYLELIRQAGFDSVRIPIRWSAHAASSAPYAIEPRFFERVDQVLGWAQKYQLAAIINIHHYEEIYVDPSSERERFLALWTQISEHYRTMPESVMFELLNEPRDKLDQAHVNALFAEVIPLIRRTNPSRTLVIGASDWNSPAALPGLKLPDGETNVVGTFHMYYPFQFTHSGAEWVSSGSSPGAKWGDSPAEQQSVDQQFNAPRQWAEAHHLPIHMGEFGAYSKADYASRVRWTRHVVDYANAHQIPWSYWEFSSGFGVYDPDAREYRKDLLAALLH